MHLGYAQDALLHISWIYFTLKTMHTENQHFTQAATRRGKIRQLPELKQFLLTEANPEVWAQTIYWMSRFFFLCCSNNSHIDTDSTIAGMQLRQSWDFRNSFISTRLTKWQCVHCTVLYTLRSHQLGVPFFSCFVSHSSRANVINIHDIQRDYSNVQTNLSQICIFHM